MVPLNGRFLSSRVPFSERPLYWDRYVTTLTNAYNCLVHSSTGTTLFDLVFSRLPPPFSLHRSVSLHKKPTTAQRNKFMRKLEAAMNTANDTLLKSQMRYKRNFDSSIRRAHRTIHTGEYVYVDPTDGATKGAELGNHALGPYRVLENDKKRSSSKERTRSNASTVAACRTSSPENVPPPEPFAKTPLDVEKNREGPTYIVDRLVAHHVADDGSLDFDVKLVDYHERTWEPRRNVPEELVSRYLARQRKAGVSPK